MHSLAGMWKGTVGVEYTVDTVNYCTFVDNINTQLHTLEQAFSELDQIWHHPVQLGVPLDQAIDGRPGSRLHWNRHHLPRR
jgi:hypothetical protein